jgi:radical SAM superfamily enzyme YgiQ (UPF0313 family)
MRILLVSPPDSFEHTPPIAVRMPTGALTSLAGNVDPHHEVAVADLILVQRRVRETLDSLVRDVRPDVLGVTAMTFQRRTAQRIIAHVRSLAPRVITVVGGYDASLAPEAWTAPGLGVDYIVRGEGELTFRALVRALEGDGRVGEIPGLIYRDGDRIVHTPPHHVSSLHDEEIRPPRRDVRRLSGYTMLGRQVDVVETSRGCTFDCSFCSIIEMRGRNFHVFTMDRVLDDIRDARARGARSIFLVDDNITLDVRRFTALCQAIIDARLDDVDYLVQAMTAPIAQHGEALAPLMRRAGFRYVFLGIENILDADLAFLRARAKNATRDRGRTVGNASAAAAALLRRHGMYVVGGLIVGSPDDDRASIEANLAFAERCIDWPYIQHPTPYPGTPMTAEFRRRGLIVSEEVEEYDGTTAVVRTATLEPEEIEFLRWRTERWIKTRHMRAAFLHSPGYVLRHARRMFAHTFRGCTLRTLVGLEDERAAFRRYREIRRREREYFGPPVRASAPARADAAPALSKAES